MSDDTQRRREIDAFFARQRREISRQIESQRVAEAFLARQRREIMATIADARESEPFFQRQAEELRVRVAADARRRGWRQLALTAAAACLFCLTGLGAWHAMTTQSQHIAGTEIWLTAWPIPGVEEVDSDPLDPFGAWEATLPGDDVPVPFDDPLLPPAAEANRLSHKLSIDDPAHALRRG